MSYRDPYSDPYYGSAVNQHQGTHAYGQNPYSDTNLNYNPYTQPSHPTYDQSGYGAGAHDGTNYTDDPSHLPQRKPTHLTQHSRSGTLHQRKDSYPPGAGFAAVPPMKKTATALRQYRYDHQGALWTRGGRGRCVGRFCGCTIMTVVFLIVSIVLAFGLWVRPPGIIIGDVQPVSQGGSEVTTQSDGSGISLTVHLQLNITVDNPNSFSVNFKQIKAELFYPINNTAIGGGTATDVMFPANTRTHWTFPFNVQYKTSLDPGGKVLSDLLSRCGTQKQNLDILYKITPALRILFIIINPSISNSFSFPCPFDPAQLGGGISGI